MAKKPTYEELEQRLKVLEKETAKRKLAEQALRESEEKFRRLFEASPDGILVTDIETKKYRYANPALCKLLGYSEEEIAGLGIFDVHPKDKLEHVISEFEAHVEGEITLAESIPFLRKDGTIMYVDITGTTVIMDGKNCSIGFLRDITDRKRAGEALQKAHNELEERVEERTAELVEANEQLKQEIEERKRAEEALQESISRVQIAYDQSIIYAKELREGIAERKQAEEALVRAKEDWENTFDAITDMVMLLDSEHRIIRVNKAAAEALNTSKEDLVGKKCYEAIHRQDHPIRRCPLVETMKSLEPQTIELTDPELGGTFICSTSPILDREGKLTGYTHTLKDITESKRLEAQLQQAQKMEAIGTLAGGIAHDFNNLLMGIQGRTSLMFTDVGSDHPHFAHLSGVEDMVKRGADLSRQLLGFARGGKYEVRATDLNDLIEKNSEMFGRTKKEIKVHGKYQKDIWAVEVDRGQIEQVLLNLYVNAWQAMPEGGDLYVETKNVTLSEIFAKPSDVEPGNYVKISVTDTGVGMDEATRQRVFEPFFTTREVGGGTGLGLASTYGIIKGHQGIINVYSEKGYGTTFNIYLPASDKEVMEDMEPIVDVLLGTETILLVDDEDTILEVGKEMLTTLGYKVTLARSGKQAIELYKENEGKTDMVILDMIMPDMGGGEVYDRLKEINPHIKVLLSSGYSIDGQANDILQRGCDGFIQKPFNLKQLSSKLREVLHK